MKQYYHYNDVFILPNYSEVRSRKNVDTRPNLFSVDIPVMSAAMDTITNSELAIAMWKYGAIGVLHRFMTIKENVNEYKLVVEENANCIVSVGVNEGLERVDALYDVGAEYFSIDIAHGYSVKMREMISRLRQKYPEVYIIAGNVGTPEAVIDLHNWGANMVKVGLSGGKVCVTKNVTGVETPMFTTIQKCAKTGIPIIADGGIRSSGDIAKAIAAGAKFIMSGYLFSGCKEAPNKINGNRVYRGMASESAMEKIGRTDTTAEGVELEVDAVTTVPHVLKKIKDGLASSMSYVGASNIREFQEKAKFGVHR